MTNTTTPTGADAEREAWITEAIRIFSSARIAMSWPEVESHLKAMEKRGKELLATQASAAAPAGDAPLSKESLIEYLDGLYECMADGSVTNRKCDFAQIAIAALRDDPAQGLPNLAEYGALRQYKHNDSSEGFVTAYDYEVTNRYLGLLRARLAAGAPAGTPTIPQGYALVPEAADADEIVTRLYRRFKDWAARGFGPDDVTWCEVKADVLAMIAKGAPAETPKPVGRDGHLRSDLRDLLHGMSVSVDVSTGEADAMHRYFGTINEVMDGHHGEKNGVVLLVADAEPNFATPAATIGAGEGKDAALREALQKIIDTIPAHNSEGGGFFIEHHGPDGEYLGSQQISPDEIIQEISAIAQIALAVEN